MLTKIQVTDEHIRRGQVCSSRQCPIALAIGELLNDDHFVAVGIVQADIRKWGSDDRPIEKMLSIDCVQFVRDFDRKRDVSPISFELEIPKEALA